MADKESNDDKTEESPFSGFEDHSADDNLEHPADQSDSKDTGEGAEEESVDDDLVDAEDKETEGTEASPQGGSGDDDGNNDDDDLTDAPDEEEKLEDTPDPEPEPKKKKTVQERINEVTKKYRSEERRAAAAEKRAAEFEERLAALEKPLTDDTKSDKGETKGAPGALKVPNPDDFDYGEVDPAYIEALTDYRVDAKLAKRDAKREEKRQAAAQEAQQQELRAQYDAKIEAGAEAYDDFQEVVVARADSAEYPLTQETALMALESPVGEHVLYHIATNPKLAVRISKMPLVEQAKTFGRLEARYVDSINPPKSRTNKVPSTSSPAPRRRTSAGVKKVDARTLNFADFEKKANARAARQNRK